MKKIKVVIFAPEIDTGGQGFRIKNAFDKYQPDFEVHSIHNLDAYFQYPSDIRATAKKVYDLFAEADVAHFRNGLAGLKRVTKYRNGGPPLGLVAHYHGTIFREDHQALHRAAVSAGATELVSTLDLKILEDGLIWLPSPYPLADLANLRVLEQRDYVRVCHAPTNRLVKSTDLVMAAMREIRSDLPVKLDLIERRPWKETLERKGRADIYVDQFHLGYGNNAVEAWGMGIPVIAGVSNPIAREAMINAWGELPFYEATPKNVAEKIKDLATDLDLRAHWGEVGRRHVETYHDDRVVSRNLAFIYRNSI